MGGYSMKKKRVVVSLILFIFTLTLFFLCDLSLYITELKRKAEVGERCLVEHREKESNRIEMKHRGVWKEWEIVE